VLLVLRRTAGGQKIIAVPAGLGAAVLTATLLPFAARQFFHVEIGPVSLLNTFAALILPGMANGYAIFLLKGFFDSLPEELFEAGKIDGASELRMFWQVAFPLSKPIFAVMALQTFTSVYGSYLWALIVCQSDRMWTLMVYIFQLQQFSPQYVTMAATVIASVPTLLVFIFAQKTIMRGIIIPAYK
jgi:multiple sugar transport system permease protein